VPVWAKFGPYGHVSNNVFRGQLRRRVYNYLDDIMTVVRYIPHHLRDLQNIFHQLRSNRLRCNLAKCEFAQSKVVFVGFTISSEGIGTADNKLDIIRQAQPPKSVKGVHRILGMFNYLRKMVRDYSQNTFHMRQLLQKDVEFQWNENCYKALNYIKTALLSSPILQPLDPQGT